MKPTSKDAREPSSLHRIVRPTEYSYRDSFSYGFWRNLPCGLMTFVLLGMASGSKRAWMFPCACGLAVITWSLLGWMAWMAWREWKERKLPNDQAQRRRDHDETTT